MKKRHNVSQSVKQFCKMINEGQVVFDYPLQRDHNQWSHYQKSLLIYSLATDYAVPEIYSVGIMQTTPAGHTEMKYSVLDGKQRLTSINSYLLGEFPLHEDTPVVRIGDYVFDIGGLYFCDIDPTVQDAINDYMLNMHHFINTTDDELAEMIFFLNNGTAMSSQQKAKTRMGLESARTLNELTSHPFVTDCLVMSSHQRKKAGDEQVLVQAMMLMDKDLRNVALSAKDITDYCIKLKAGKERMFIQLEKAMDYLVESCPEPHELYKKKHAPYLLALIPYVIQKGIKPHVFNGWMSAFTWELEAYDDLHNSYLEGIKGTSNKKVNMARDHMLYVFDTDLARLLQMNEKE